MSENGSMFDEPLRLAAEEWTKRLKDNPGEIPAHALANGMTTLYKLRGLEGGGEEEVKTVAPLAALDSLPPERAAELLRAEIARLEDGLAAYRLRLAELEEVLV